MTEAKMPFHPAQSLSKQLTRRVFLLSLIGIMGLVGTIILGLLFTLQQIQTQMDDINVEAARAFDMFFLNLQSDLLASGDSLVSNGDADLALLQIRARNNSILDVLLVDFEGTVLAQRNAVGRPKQTDIGQPSWLESPPPFGEVYVGPVGFEGQAPFVDIAVTATDDIGLPAGLLLARVDLTELWNTTLDIKVGETGYAYIVDDSGQLVAYRNRRLLETGSNLADLVGHTPQEIAESGLSLYVGLSDQLVLASAQPLKAVPWFAIVAQPLGEALAPFLKPAAILVIVLALVGLLLFSFVKFTRVRIVSPLLTLNEAVAQMAGGQLDQKIEVKYDDELGHLADAFNIMAAEIRAKMDELTELNQSLQASEQKYRELVETLNDVIYTLDENGVITYMSPAIETIAGYGASEVVGQNFSKFIYEEDLPYLTEQFQHVLEGDLHPDEFRTLTKSGEIRWVRSHSHPFYAEGNVIGIRGMLTDITKRRRLETAIKNIVVGVSADLGERFLESMVIQLARAIEADYALIGELTGEDKRSIQTLAFCTSGRISENFVYSLDHTPCDNVLEQGICLYPAGVKDLFPEDISLQELDVQGYAGIPLVDAQNQAIGLMVTLYKQPIPDPPLAESGLQVFAARTAAELERLRAENEIRRQNRELALLSQAIEQTVECIVITDTEGNIIYINPAFTYITGYHRQDVAGQNMRILKSGEQDAEFYQKLWAALSAGKVWQGRFVNRKKDGTLYTAESTIAPVRNENGVIINYVAVQNDVTRELELERQFLQSQKMDAMGQLTGGIAHDFNNLLTAMNGFAELLQHRLHSDDSSLSMVNNILNAGQRAADLVRQLMAFSRKQIIEPKLLNLNAVVTEMDKMLRRVIGEDIDLTAILTPDLWTIKADPAQVQQIVMNLAVNARDAMPTGGQLTIETKNVVLDEAYTAEHLAMEAGEYVLLAVSDTGTGMSQAVQARIFEPFYTTKEQGKGTGLGLATVFGIVKQSDGDIQVYSEEGHGTVFKIYLPRADEPELDVANAKQDKRMPQGTETVLVVEDEVAVRELIMQTLHESGYTLIGASNGSEALKLSQTYEADIHLLLTDVIMPQMSGKELAEQLVAQRPKLKILFASGYTDDAIAQHGVLDPGVTFIQKPFSPVALAKKVREVLDQTV